MLRKTMTICLTLCAGFGLFVACGAPSENEEDLAIARVSRHHHTTTGGSSSTSSSSTGSGGSTTGRSITCFSGGAPDTVCTGADHCCFSNYSALHDGYCATTTCEFGTLNCDGPEDCPAGNVCCAQRFTDPSGVALSYTVACRTGSSCPSGTWQLCHSTAPANGGCPAGTTCQSGVNFELPKAIQNCAP